jgi:hypothetical protein
MNNSAILVKKLANIIHSTPTKRYLWYIYNSPQWQRIRRQHLERVGGWCEICHIRKAYSVHHWSYARLGHEEPSDLCAVCAQCHHDLHVAVLPPANDNEPPTQLPLAL